MGVVGVLAGAEPFSADGGGPAGQVGVVVCHGFTGCPQSMRPWAEGLAAAGYTVRLPRLPGHGTTWQEMQATRWPDWYGEVDRAYTELQGRCDTVFAVGLSMGGTLAFRLAEQHADTIAGIVTVNAFLASRDKRLLLLPVLKHLLPSLPGVGSDIKKPGVTELAYARTPLKAVASTRKRHETHAPAARLGPEHLARQHHARNVGRWNHRALHRGIFGHGPDIESHDIRTGDTRRQCLRC